MAITIYSGNDTDFYTNGLGLLYPTECTITESAAGQYELKLTHPIDDSGRHLLLENGNIIKAPAPVRVSPAYIEDADTDGETVVTRYVYEVYNTSHGEYMRAGAGTNYPRYGYLRNGARVILIEQVSDRWLHVITEKGGRDCYMSTKHLRLVDSFEETIKDGQVISARTAYPTQSAEQLFRIVDTETDSESQTKSVTALHISYDDRVNLIAEKYESENDTVEQVADVLQAIQEKCLNEPKLRIHADHLQGTVKPAYSYKSPIEALLDPENGIVKQTKAHVIRDNYDVYLIPDSIPTITGVTIRRGKNLIGVNAKADANNLVTRIIPAGKDTKDKELFIERVDETGNTVNYIDSPNINAYPLIYTKKIDYDVSIVDSGADNITKFSTKKRKEARDKLTELAQKEFDENSVDVPVYTMDVSFVMLQDCEDYENYAALQAVFLYDTVRVIDELVHIDQMLMVTDYEWDALAKQYRRVTLGKIEDIEPTVYSYNLPNGGISGAKLASGTVIGSAMRDATITYAKLQTAAIEQLSTDTIAATIAHLGDVDAETIDTNELTAQIANVIRLYANKLTANEVVTNDFIAAMAHVVDFHANDAEIGRAYIEHLVSKALHITDAVGENVFIDNLQIKQAQILHATIKDLIIGASDGGYYKLDIDEHGHVVTTNVTEFIQPSELENSLTAAENAQAGGERVIIETDILADQLAASDMKSIHALINKLEAALIDVDELTARKAFIEQLTVGMIVGNKSLNNFAEDVQNVISDVEKHFKFQVDGMHIVNYDTTTGMHPNEVFIDDKSVQIKVQNEAYAQFLAREMQLGNMRVWQPETGGLAFGRI